MIVFDGRNWAAMPEVGSITPIMIHKSYHKYNLIEADLPKLRTTMTYCGTGSEAYCIDTGKTYLFVKDTMTWYEKASGGSTAGTVWGEITGTLADQTDLAQALAMAGGVPALAWHNGTNTNTITAAEIGGETFVKVYKNGLLMQPSTNVSAGTLEFETIADLASLLQVDDATIDLDVDGVAISVEHIDFTQASDIPELASVINTAADGAFYCSVNPAGTGIIFTSPTLGSNSSVETNADTAPEMIALFGGGDNMVETAGTGTFNDYYISGTSIIFNDIITTNDKITTEVY